MKFDLELLSPIMGGVFSLVEIATIKALYEKEKYWNE